MFYNVHDLQSWPFWRFVLRDPPGHPVVLFVGSRNEQIRRGKRIERRSTRSQSAGVCSNVPQTPLP